jgi:hypothetical protein
MVEWGKMQIPALMLWVVGLSGVVDLMGGLLAVRMGVAAAVSRLVAVLVK